MAAIEISCREVWRELSNYIDGDVPAELRDRIAAHLETCRHCLAVYDGARNVIQLVADGKAFDLPAGFSERLRARLAHKIDRK